MTKTYFCGVDLAYGMTTSKTAVVVLNDESDTPVMYSLWTPEAQDLDKRFVEIAAFCRTELVLAGCKTSNSLTHISQPKMSMMHYDKYNPKTGRKEKKTAMSKSTIGMAQVRGATLYALHNITEVRGIVESSAKLKFTGSGKAKKEKILLFAKSKWAKCPTDSTDVADAYMNAYVIRESYREARKW